MAVADAAVARASSTGTSTDAPAELQLATSKLASAHQAMQNKDMELASRLAEQAEIDAQVAELHAQSARSQRAATESQAAARALREEINRKTPR